MWELNINTISKTAGKYLQESYSAVIREIQSEWLFLQHVTNNLPYFLFGNPKILKPIIKDLRTKPVKKSGLGLRNPMTSANDKYLSYQRTNKEFIRAVTGGGVFSNDNYLLVIRKERRDRRKTGMMSMTPNSKN